MSPEKVTVYIGTSGYSFADWSKVFYPAGLPKSKWLEYYVRHFPSLELNTSYYCIPAKSTIKRLVDETPPRYPVMVKANGETTHKYNDADISARFRESIDPLVETDRLRGVLAQFPWSFRNTPKNRDYIAQMVQRTPDVTWFVEFRRREWIVPEVGNLLRELGAGFVSVDEPQISGMMPPVAKFTIPVAYIRLHGRNSEAWWSGDPGSGRDRYDYRYNSEELDFWARKVLKLAGDVREMFVFFNNCHEGQAVDNAVMMRNMLRQLAGKVAGDKDTPELVIS